MKKSLELIHQKVDVISPISLSEMDSVSLLNRKDSKFILSHDKLATVLNHLSSDYHVLEIAGKRIMDYETAYYDSSELDLYQQHHNAKKNRFKIRYRRYVDSDLCFLEVKRKDNKGTTFKTRTVSAEMYDDLIYYHPELLKGFPEVTKHVLSRALDVYYKRFTLVAKDFSERVTVDLGLEFKMNYIEKKYDNLAIIELKQGEINRKSPCYQVLRMLQVPQQRISKYCIGVLNCYDEVKYNRFKKLVRTVESVNNYGRVA